METVLILIYLAAIVTANLLVAAFGPSVVTFNAFALIGLDLIARDALHERWHGRNLKRNMFLLVLSGSALSALFSLDALRVAVASFVAFSCTGFVDTLAYSLLHDRARWVKMNGSNIPASAVDSVIFIALVFGFPLMWDVILLAIAAKIAGGFVWSIVISAAEGKRCTATATRSHRGQRPQRARVSAGTGVLQRVRARSHVRRDRADCAGEFVYVR
jgi:uncharacterized PurR-regulated membrane protein YhhQ (DUF165 family)